jgi:hypothetical protein
MSEEFASILEQAVARANQGPGGDGAEANYQRRVDRREFGIQPRPAGEDFEAGRLFVNATLAAILEFEVLDSIGQVNTAPVNPCIRECAIEQSTGGPDEGSAFSILTIAWLFSDHHDAGSAGTFA